MGGQLTQLQQGDVVFLGADVEVLVDQHFANSYSIPKQAKVQGYPTQHLCCCKLISIQKTPQIIQYFDWNGGNGQWSMLAYTIHSCIAYKVMH